MDVEKLRHVLGRNGHEPGAIVELSDRLSPERRKAYETACRALVDHDALSGEQFYEFTRGMIALLGEEHVNGIPRSEVSDPKRNVSIELQIFAQEAENISVVHVVPEWVRWSHEEYKRKLSLETSPLFTERIAYSTQLDAIPHGQFRMTLPPHEIPRSVGEVEWHGFYAVEEHKRLLLNKREIEGHLFVTPNAIASLARKLFTLYEART